MRECDRKSLSSYEFSDRCVRCRRGAGLRSRSITLCRNRFSFPRHRRTPCTTPTREEQIRALEQDWAQNPRWKGIQRSYSARRRRSPARLGPGRAHAGQARRREALEPRQHRALRQHARRADRQPGDAAGQGRPEGDLPLGLAGRGRRQHRRRDVPGPVALSGQLGAGGRQAHQQHLHARRPDPVVGRQERRSTTSRRSSPTPKPASAACSTRSS